MNANPTLLGSWVHAPEPLPATETRPCVWQFVDDRTCVVDQQTEMGRLVSWFQYWTEPGAILRYPLGSHARHLFRVAEGVPFSHEDGWLMINGHRFRRAEGMLLPDRLDLLPGRRPGDDGRPVPSPIRVRLEEYLDHPPQASR